MNEPYLDEVSERLTSLLKELPKAEQSEQMDELERWAFDSGYFNSNPRRNSPELYSFDLFTDPGMAELVNLDSENRNAVGAEDPVDMVLRLLPSDGHLD